MILKDTSQLSSQLSCHSRAIAALIEFGGRKDILSPSGLDMYIQCIYEYFECRRNVTVVLCTVIGGKLISLYCTITRKHQGHRISVHPLPASGQALTPLAAVRS